MTSDADRHALLASAIDGATSWYDVYKNVRDAVPAGHEQEHRALAWVFAYDLVAATDPERREREGSPYGAIVEFAEGRMPPRLGDVPDEDVALWVDAFDAVDDPRVRSRLGDLLWCRRVQPGPHLKARAACDALVSLSGDEDWEPLDSTEGLVRALELALELGDDRLVHSVACRASQAAREEMARDDRPGITFRLLRALVDLRPAQRPAELSTLIEHAETLYRADPHHVESAIDLKAFLVAPDERPALRRQQAELWRATARTAGGILRPTFLEKALDVARTHGLAELARDLRVELQALTEEDLDLKTVSTDIAVDRKEMERFHGAFTQFDSWEQSLVAFGAYGPPGGEPDAIERQVTQQMQDFPLQYLVSQVMLDPDLSAPVWHAVDEPSHRAAAVAQGRSIASQLWALSAVTILEALAEKYGRPDEGELAAFFTTAAIDARTAERIARSFSLWWDHRSDESAHLLVPRLENVIRNLAREAGFPIIREPVAGKPGGVRPLGDLLHSLGGRLASPGWHAYFYHLLSDPLGLNLRNVIAHGVRAQIDRGDAALLLHAAAFLRLLAVERRPHPD